MSQNFADGYHALHHDAVWTDRRTRDARIEVRGPDATSWLHGLLTQDIASLQPGQGARAAYLTPQGRMVAELRVLQRGDVFLLETPAAARAQLLSRLDQFVIMEDVTVTDVTDTIGCLTILGPTSAATASACTGLAMHTLEALADDGQVALEVPGAFVARTPDFGVTGFDLFAPQQSLGTWRRTLETKCPLASEGLLETARIEAGRPRFGVDMHEETIPLEAGLESRAISFDKGCYVGQEVVIRILHRGQGRVVRRLVWLVAAPYSSDGAVWAGGDSVVMGGKAVGAVTSACWSPARRGLLGIAMLHRDATESGTMVSVAGIEATVERLP